MRKLILSLSIVLLFMGCDTEPMDEEIKVNPFVGEWEGESGGLYVFAETSYISYTPNKTIWVKGTYEYTNTHLFITVNKEESVEGMQSEIA